MEEKIPKGWKKARLGEILDYEQPQKYIVKSEKYDEEHGIPVLTPGKAFILGYIEESFGIFKDVPIILFDDFTTESKYVTFPFKVKSSAVKILKLKKRRENVLYIVYNLMQILNFKPGSEHKRFWISEYSKIKVSLPPLPEQHLIAEILETVDNTIEKTDKIIEKYKRIKQGLMQDLMTKGIDENWQIRSEETHKFKDSELGRIPEEWEVVELGKVGEIVTGSTPSTEKKEYYGDEYQFISPEDISEKKHITKTIKRLSKLGFKISRKIPPKSICVVCIGSTIGKVALTTDNCTTNQQINTIIPYKDVYDSESLYYFVLFYIQKPLIQEAGLQAVPIVNKNRFSQIKIPLPPLPEQQRIASVLSQIDEVIEREQKYKEKLERIKKGLMEDLLSGKVRVNHLIEETKIGVENV